DANMIVGDIISTKFPNDYFDCVVDIECLVCNDWNSTVEIIKEIIRILKPEGSFFSQTFSDKTSIGEKFTKVEENTYKEIIGSSLGRKRLLRLLPEKDLYKLYSGFSKIFYDKLFYTYQNMKYESEELLISCYK
ncbi:MAG: methyltransferase domain-containing protein, partial [Nitrospirae bacterium]|nr:methyltransferase domain-containing protein [Nitrospirota bacterium]